MSYATPRYSPISDEYIFIEFSEDMSLEVSLEVMRVSQALKAAALRGVAEVSPGNVSVLVRTDPEQCPVEEVCEICRERIEATRAGRGGGGAFTTRIVEIPVLYEDPWTAKVVDRWRHLNHDPDLTDLEFAAQTNGFATTEAFIEAHASTPYIISMVGFVPGAAWYYQVVEPERQLEVPKYVTPRIGTPARAVGQGGSFSAIYPVEGAGGYQLYGRTPVPVLETARRLEAFEDSMVLMRPGDLVKFRRIDRDEYDRIERAVAEGSYEHRIAPEVSVSRSELLSRPEAYSRRLVAEAMR